ncbi:MAG: hypothetical protein HXX13_11590 [Bacteroidetes bacterium]|nr:hypothetical protein [Bacteroidota bacterium]
MAVILEILKYILPSLLVLATAYYLLRELFAREKSREVLQLKVEAQKASLPVRMQAYERLVLLLERIQPAGLILRTSAPGMNASSMHAALIQAVRDEYDHNLSQQLYVSSEAWERVKNSREEAIKMINSAATLVAPEASVAELAQHILVQDMEQVHDMTNQAIEFLKQEARNNFF